VKTSRLEAFSDGVIAVIITIMVLELKVPHVGTPDALLSELPSLLVYGLSFLIVAIMWVNHHHLVEMAYRADPALLWSNNNLLFWMSLIPFATAYLGENYHAPLAVAIYGSAMTFAASGFVLLQNVLAKQNRDNPSRQLEFKRINRKAMISLGCYAASVPLAWVSIYLSFAIFVIIALAYFWPERKVAKIE
jgi:uncharacterized membrane protein